MSVLTCSLRWYVTRWIDAADHGADDEADGYLEAARRIAEVLIGRGC